jgi:hypothetical protein
VIVFDLPWHGKSSPPPGFEGEAYQLTTDLYVDTYLLTGEYDLSATPALTAELAKLVKATHFEVMEGRYGMPTMPFDQRLRNICWSISSTECGEIPSCSNPGISGEHTLSTCISST